MTKKRKQPEPSQDELEEEFVERLIRLEREDCKHDEFDLATTNLTATNLRNCLVQFLDNIYISSSKKPWFTVLQVLRGYKKSKLPSDFEKLMEPNVCTGLTFLDCEICQSVVETEHKAELYDFLRENSAIFRKLRHCIKHYRKHCRECCIFDDRGRSHEWLEKLHSRFTCKFKDDIAQMVKATVTRLDDETIYVQYDKFYRPKAFSLSYFLADIKQQEHFKWDRSSPVIIFS